MGTRKGSNAKKDSSPTAMKHKSTSNTHPIARPQKARRRREVKKGWEEWEDSLIMALQKEGKIDRRISQHLPGRNESSCRQRRCKLNAQSRSVSAQPEDVLACRAPRNSTGQRRGRIGRIKSSQNTTARAKVGGLSVNGCFPAQSVL